MAQSDGRVSAEEAASGGVTWTFAPMTDVSRDPRWGRVAEGFGEDTLLNAVFGAAKVRGYGDSLADPGAILACAKHYVGYGAAEGGRDCNTVDISEYRLRNVHLEPPRGKSGHRACIVGDADGVPNLLATASPRTCTTPWCSRWVPAWTWRWAATSSVPAGGPPWPPTTLPVERVDDAVRRVLRLKFALGLFDDLRRPRRGDHRADPCCPRRRTDRRGALGGAAEERRHATAG